MSTQLLGNWIEKVGDGKGSHGSRPSFVETQVPGLETAVVVRAGGIPFWLVGEVTTHFRFLF